MLATAHCTTGNSWFWQETLPHPNRPFSKLYLWHPLSKVLIRSETRLMFLEWFNPHQARADGKQEMSPPKESNPLSKLVKRVCTTPLREEIDTRVRAGARQSDPRYSLSHSLSLSLSLPLPLLNQWFSLFPHPPSREHNLLAICLCWKTVSPLPSPLVDNETPSNIACTRYVHFKNYTVYLFKINTCNV